MSKECKDLILAMCNKDSSARPSCVELLQHPWLMLLWLWLELGLWL